MGKGLRLKLGRGMSIKAPKISRIPILGSIQLLRAMNKMEKKFKIKAPKKYQ